MNPVTQALAAAIDAAMAESREWALGRANGARVERLARKFCEADSRDPDTVTMGRPGQPPLIGAKGTVGLVMPLQPQWMLYINEALTAIEFTEATK